ncbi:hypothetical protein [Rahnella inusitata]|uniref:hypothetical protein n=1 Tax=Rahnella inusitata TaxID=58169 RepID=UPI0039B0AAF3
MSYIITVMNGTNVDLDKNEYMHTWLKFEDTSLNQPVYFSFGPTDEWSWFGFDSTGKFDYEHVTTRVPTEQIQFIVTKEQYDIAVAMKVFYETKGNVPTYDLLPDGAGDNDYNCTRLSNEVLKKGGIYFLDNTQTPFGVANKINNTDKVPNSDYVDLITYDENSSAGWLDTTMDFKDIFDRSNTEIKDANLQFIENIGNNIPFLNPFIDQLNKNQAARDAYASLIDESDLTPEEKNKYYAELAEYTKRKSSEFKKSSDNFNITLANNPGLASHPALLIPIALGTYFGPSILEALRASSPIILDLDGDGVENISLSEGVYFDHDGNAFAEKSGWVGKDDGLLVLDINQDGQIDSGRELFGNNTYLKDGTLAKNGYLALQELDDDHNGIIDSVDAIWQQLNVWQDKNSNGKVDSGELLSLDSLKISSIATGYTNSTVIDDKGNTHQQDSSFTFNDGTRGASSDVWFDANKGDTRSDHSQPLPDDILAMPYIRGFGNMTDLHTAMAGNSDLEALVRQATASQNDIDILTDQIICAWAG